MSSPAIYGSWEDVVQKAQGAIEDHDLLASGDGVVVGLSGGPDSLCLLHVLRRLRQTYNLRLHVAHLNHGARGDASDADAEFVRSLARRWQLPVTVERRDVPGLADKHGLAFEEAARRMRYAFLARVARRTDAAKIAVGHNADDQAETVLMHVIRGSGLAGLRGMLPSTPITDYRLLTPLAEQEPEDGTQGGSARERREPGRAGYATPKIIRPLLTVTRPEVEQYCAEHELEPRFDRSNLDTTYFRNRLRHQLLPELETYNPNIRERLCHTAAVAAADYEVLIHMRRKAWQTIVREEREDAIIFERAAWRALPVSLQRATLRHATYQLRRNLRDVTFTHVEKAREVALEGATGKASTLPKGLVLTVGYDVLTVGERGKPGPPPDEPLLWTDATLPVRIPGATPLPHTGWVLVTKVLDRWTMAEIAAPGHPWTAFFDAKKLPEPLTLRRRRTGDRIPLLGMDGSEVKVSDLMINLKIPETWRSHVPLLAAAGDIVWVCGRRVAESAKVTSETEVVVKLRFERAS